MGGMTAGGLERNKRWELMRKKELTEKLINHVCIDFGMVGCSGTVVNKNAAKWSVEMGTSETIIRCNLLLARFQLDDDDANGGEKVHLEN